MEIAIDALSSDGSNSLAAAIKIATRTRTMIAATARSQRNERRTLSVARDSGQYRHESLSFSNVGNRSARNEREHKEMKESTELVLKDLHLDSEFFCRNENPSRVSPRFGLEGTLIPCKLDYNLVNCYTIDSSFFSSRRSTSWSRIRPWRIWYCLSS